MNYVPKAQWDVIDWDSIPELEDAKPFRVHWFIANKGSENVIIACEPGYTPQIMRELQAGEKWLVFRIERKDVTKFITRHQLEYLRTLLLCGKKQACLYSEFLADCKGV